jgi:hypothetical protein
LAAVVEPEPLVLATASGVPVTRPVRGTSDPRRAPVVVARWLRNRDRRPDGRGASGAVQTVHDETVGEHEV